MPPRNPQPPRSSKFVPYLAFIMFCAFFVFKVDVIISQTISTARSNRETPSKIVIIPLSNDTFSPPSNGTFNPSPSNGTFNPSPSNGTFNRHFIITWGEHNARMLDGGELLTLSLDKSSGSGFESKKEFLFTKIDMQIKLVPGNSAGTVTTYYLTSQGDHHDEIDFEFLGNSSGNPYTLHTNVFSQGKGEREQQFFLWFDPTLDFHTYTILWNPKNIIFYVDNIPIREFKNAERLGVPFPKDQPMRIESSLWNAEEWATQHGLVKTNWSLAPFTASYRNFAFDGCTWLPETGGFCSAADFETKPVLKVELDRRSRARMKKLQRDHMVYDYCKDKWRFPKGPGPECKIN